MIKRIFLLATVFIMLSCSNTRIKYYSDHTVKAGEYSMTAELIKANEPAGYGEDISFSTTLSFPKSELEETKDITLELQYHADSAFFLKSGNETYWPQYVIPIANGRSLNPQYIVSFDKLIPGIDQGLEFHSNWHGLSELKGKGILFTATEIKKLSN